MFLRFDFLFCLVPSICVCACCHLRRHVLQRLCVVFVCFLNACSHLRRPLVIFAGMCWRFCFLSCSWLRFYLVLFSSIVCCCVLAVIFAGTCCSACVWCASPLCSVYARLCRVPLADSFVCLLCCFWCVACLYVRLRVLFSFLYIFYFPVVTFTGI